MPSIVARKSAGKASKVWTSRQSLVHQACTIADARDCPFGRDSRVSLGTLNGRSTIPSQGYDKHRALIRRGASIGDAKLWYDTARKTFSLLVALEIDGAEATYEQLSEVVGVDVGIGYVAVTSTGTGKATFHAGNRIRHTAKHYARLRKRLQQKGRRGSNRRVRCIEQRERRLKVQAKHTMAKQIGKPHPHALIGLEQLTSIPERTQRKKRRRKKNDKGYEQVSPQARHPPIGSTQGGPVPSCTT